MDRLEESRAGNRVFKIDFPDQTRIYFKLLSWKRFNAYNELSLSGSLPADIIENAIFDECVLDAVVKQNIGSLRAGVVATVVGIIMALSGPGTPESTNESIEMARLQVDSLSSQIVMVICRAFPAYKPEDIEDMPWQKVLQRLTQAERILMTKNPPELEEPISVVVENEREKELSPGDKLMQDMQALAKFEQENPNTSQAASLENLTPRQIEQLRKAQEIAKRRQG